MCSASKRLFKHLCFHLKNDLLTSRATSIEDGYNNPDNNIPLISASRRHNSRRLFFVANDLEKYDDANETSALRQVSTGVFFC